MTSKNLFFKLMKEDGRQRLWSFVLAMVVFFFVLPVAGASIAATSWGDAERVSENIISYLNGSSLLFIITITGALICGISGFSYLHGKKKVDFYHGIPVRRETLFAVSYINGVLIYLIPFLFHLLLYVLLTMGKCLNMSMLFQVLFCNLVIHLAYYLIIYTLMIMSVLLTGNMLTSIMVFFMISFYVLAIQAVNLLYHSYFYETYWEYEFNSVFNIHTSPLVSYMSTLGDVARLLEYHRTILIWQRLGIVLVVWMVMVAVCVWLYRIRPSESAEKSIAFAPCKPVLYFAVSLPVSLSGAIFFSELMGGVRSMGWLVFGLVCFWMLIHGFLQIVMEMEFKAIFRGLIKMGVAGAVAMVVMMIFLFDLTGFDSYRPSQRTFQSAAVSIGGLNDNIFLTGTEDHGYRNSVSLAMERMAVTDYDAVMALLDKTGMDAEADGNGIWELDEIRWSRLYIKIRLNSGKDIYRVYMISSENLEEMNRLYGIREFREGTYPILTQSEDLFTDIYFDNGLETRHLEIENTERLRLFRTFQEEYDHMTVYDMQQVPYGTLVFAVGENDGSEPYYYVYPSMKETIKLLTDSGMESRQEAAVRLCEAVRIYPGTLYRVLEDQGQGFTEDVPEEAYYTAEQPEKLKELLSVAAPSHWFNSLVLVQAPWLEIMVYQGSDEHGNTQYDYFSIPKDAMPDFVLKDLRYDEAIRRLQESRTENPDGMDMDAVVTPEEAE